MASFRRFGLPLIALSLVAGPLAAQMRPVTPQTLKSLQAREGQRFELASSYIHGLRSELGLGSEHAFAFSKGHTDELGVTHARFQQLYQGVRVWGGDVITHTDMAGRQLAPTQDLKRSIQVSVTPNLDSSEAIAVAHRDLAPKGGYARAPITELVIYADTTEVIRGGHVAHAREADQAPDATQVERQVVRYVLAYYVRLALENGADETVHRVYLVDAQTGAILTQWNDLHTSAAVGTGRSQWYGTVNLSTNSVTSGFEMRDMTRGTGGTFGNNITTNLNHATTGNGTIYTDADNAWGDGNGYGSGTTTSTTGATGQTAAVDQHRGMAVAWDFYKNVFGRNGIDGTGKASYGRMHYGSNYDNAFWDDSCFCMTYGDGAPPSGSYGEADLDTVGHELTHGVCATSANLTYSGESGGLNESNSDIFGTCVEFYALGAGGTGSVVPDATGSGAAIANYTMFENSWGHAGQALRYMYKPSLDGSSPDAWSSSTGGLDVHYSSGPMNRCFYFMARGATTSGDTSTTLLPSGMSGIGNDHAARIWYRALTVYLTASSNYAAARTASISSAKDLYGAGSAEEIAVWNAFHGINVGAAWTGGSTAPVLTGQPQSVTVQVGTTATFTVTATGSSLTYQWRKNGTSISGATAASYTTPATTSTDNGATFSVVVTNISGSVTSNNATLTVTTTPPPAGTFNEVESNGTTAAANVVGTTFNKIVGTIGASGDLDFFAVTLANGETLTVNMTGPALDYDLALLNSAGTSLKSSTGSTATETVTYQNTGAAATFYIKVLGYSGANSTTPYNLALVRSSSTVTAPVLTGQPQSATVVTGATATFTVTATGSSLGYQWRKNGTSISGATSVSYTTPATTSTDNGATFSVVVSNTAGSVTSSNATLTVTSTPPATTYNEVESNGSTAAANAVADNVTKIVATIGTSTDQDFFKVNVAAGRTITVNMTGPAQDYDLYLLNSAGTTLKSSEGSTATETVTYVNSGTTTATYYIKVSGYNGATSTTSYNLALTR